MLQQEWHYVTSGAALAGCAWWLLHREMGHGWFVRIGLGWLVIEQLKVAICGIGSYGLVVGMGAPGLCTARFGAWSYIVTLAAAVALALFYQSRSAGRGRGPHR